MSDADVIDAPNLNEIAPTETTGAGAGVVKMRYTEEQVLLAVKKGKGNMKATAKALKKMDNSRCGWHTADRHVAKYPAARELFEGLKQEFIDDAEQTLHDAVKGGDVQAAQYVLNTIGKDRGFTTRTEIEHKGQTVHVVISKAESEV